MGEKRIVKGIGSRQKVVAMRAVIQRVSEASVTVDQQVVGRIDAGLLVFLGVGRDDTRDDLDYIFRKTVGLRVFEDEDGKMNRDVVQAGGELLVVSQFTLFGDVRKGKRPSFVTAAPPERANELYEAFCQLAREASIRVQTGTFQAQMDVALINDGPVTILVDSRKAF